MLQIDKEMLLEIDFWTITGIICPKDINYEIRLPE